MAGSPSRTDLVGGRLWAPTFERLVHNFGFGLRLLMYARTVQARGAKMAEVNQNVAPRLDIEMMQIAFPQLNNEIIVE